MPILFFSSVVFVQSENATPIVKSGKEFGKVIQIQHIENENNPLGEPAVKISIFMSVFNVHVNRIPMDGTIKEIIYYPGKFFSAKS